MASVHMRGFTFMVVPQKFAPDPDCQGILYAHGQSEANKGLAALSEILADQEFLLGKLSIADAAAYYVLRWATRLDVELPDNLAALLQRLEMFD